MNKRFVKDDTFLSIIIWLRLINFRIKNVTFWTWEVWWQCCRDSTTSWEVWWQCCRHSTSSWEVWWRCCRHSTSSWEYDDNTVVIISWLSTSTRNSKYRKLEQNIFRRLLMNPCSSWYSTGGVIKQKIRVSGTNI